MSCKRVSIKFAQIVVVVVGVATVVVPASVVVVFVVAIAILFLLLLLLALFLTEVKNLHAKNYEGCGVGRAKELFGFCIYDENPTASFSLAFFLHFVLPFLPFPLPFLSLCRPHKNAN